MGTVYRAWHSRLRRYCAIKLLPAEMTGDPEALKRFDREMEALGRLSHPNIVSANDGDVRDGVHFLAMEYCTGLDLSQLLKQVKKIDFASVCAILLQVADGLQHAHEHGMVHRDIKPSNLMLTEDGCIRILDMGLARLRKVDSGGLTSTGQVMGTVDYMSPEQALAETVGIRSDIYSLGVTFYRLLSGVVPFGPPKYESAIKKLVARTTTPAPSILELVPDLPIEVAEACHKMLETDPQARFQQPKEIRQALQTFANEAQLSELIWNSLSSSTLQVEVPSIDDSAMRDTQSAAAVDSVETENTISMAAVSDADTVVSHGSENADDSTAQIENKQSTSPNIDDPSTWTRRWALAGFGFFCLIAGITFIATDGNRIKIESYDPDVEIEVLRGDQVQTRASAGYFADGVWYRSGQYEVRIAEPDANFAVDGGEFTLSRNSHAIVKITSVKSGRDASKKEVAALPPAITASDASSFEYTFDKNRFFQVSQDGRQISRNDENQVIVSDLDGNEKQRFRFSSQPSAHAFDDQGRRIVVVAGKSVYLYDLKDGAELASVEIDGEGDFGLVSYNEAVGKILSVWSGRLYAHDSDTLKVDRTWHFPNGYPNRFVIDPNGKRVFSAQSTHVFLFDQAQEKTIELADDMEVVDTLAVSADGSFVVAASHSDTLSKSDVRIWNSKDITDLRVIDTTIAGNRHVSATFDPESEHMICAYEDGVRSFDVRTGKVVAQHEVGGVLYRMVFNQARDLIVSDADHDRILTWRP